MGLKLHPEKLRGSASQILFTEFASGGVFLHWHLCELWNKWTKLQAVLGHLLTLLALFTLFTLFTCFTLLSLLTLLTLLHTAHTSLTAHMVHAAHTASHCSHCSDCSHRSHWFTHPLGLFPAHSFQVSDCAPYSHCSWWSSAKNISLVAGVQPWSMVWAPSLSSVFSLQDWPQPQKANKFSGKFFLYLCSLLSSSWHGTRFKPVLGLVKPAVYLLIMSLWHFWRKKHESLLSLFKDWIYNGLSYINPCRTPYINCLCRNKECWASPWLASWEKSWAHQPWAGGTSLCGLQRQHCKQQI